MASPQHSSLKLRVFLLTAVTVAATVVAALFVTMVLADGIAEDAVRADLVRAGSVRASLELQRFEELELIARLFVGDPYLAAYFAEAASSGDSFSILDLLAERQADLGFDFAIALDPEGSVLGRTDVPGGAGRDLSEEPLVRRALEEFAVYGVWSERGELYNAVAVPITSGPNLAGFLIAGFAIDDVAALDMKRVADTEVVFFSLGEGEPGAVAGTVDAAVSSDLAAAFATQSADELAEPFELDAGGERWLALFHGLSDADGGEVGAVFSLASLDREKAPYRRIGWVIGLVGLAAMLLASTALFLLSRRALEPLGRLADAAKAAAGGDLDVAIEIERKDEVGELGEAFNHLLGELREQRDMSAYLAEIARTLPKGGAQLEREAETLFAEGDPTSITGDEARPSDRPGTREQLVGGRFEILSTLGEGGMGVVYKARDHALDDVVALKTLKSEIYGDALVLERLKSELKLARSVTHPNVLRTYDFGEIDGSPFISMEYVEGIDLEELLATSGRLPYSAGLHVARHLCRGLAAVHAQGVLHRDIKPANLILQPNGNAKLMDFGIARPARDLRAEEKGKIIGTPDYMAPEQVLGNEPTERSDLYSCGVVFYEVFTGRRPFEGGDAKARMVARLREPVAPPGTLRPGLPEALEQLILRCLEPEPEDRYPNVAALLEELEALRA